MSNHFVNYTVGPPVFQQSTKRNAGPYPTWQEAELHLRDIAGYAGITDAFITIHKPAANHGNSACPT